MTETSTGVPLDPADLQRRVTMIVQYCDELLAGPLDTNSRLVAEGVRRALTAPSAWRPVPEDSVQCAVLWEPAPLPLHRTAAGYPNCSTCDGGGCLDCTDPA